MSVRWSISSYGVLAFGLNCFLAAYGIVPPAQAGPLALHVGTVDIARQAPAEAGKALLTISRSNARHAIVQFDRPVDDAVRKCMAGAGVQLQGYLGANTYFVALSFKGVDTAAMARIGSLTGVEAIRTDWKIHPHLTGGRAPAHAVVERGAQGGDIIGAYILFHPDVDMKTDAGPILARHGAVLRDVLETVNGAVIELPAANVASIAAEDGVQWIEPPLPRMSPTNAENRIITQVDDAQVAPYNLDGSGVNVLVYGGGTALSTHLDFGGRLTVRDASGTTDQATHVAGTIGGSGAVSGGTFRGMAPAVTMQSYGFQHDGTGTFLYTNPGDIETDYSEAISSFGVDISNNSIGTNTEANGFPCSIQGDYGVTDAVIDAIVRGSLGGGPFTVIWANGNERQGSRCDVEGFGDYYSVAPPATAKNHITVGALNANDDSLTSFTSWGPTDDGRMKPDVSAPGCQSGGDGGVTSCNASGGYSTECGSSTASPTVCGSCALLLQDFRDQFPGAPDPRNSTLKILLAHNAQDIQNVGPDYQTGYGSIRIKDTIDFMRTGNFLEGEVGQSETLSVLAPVSAGAAQLKVTIAWDDVPGTPNVVPSLINDLDLRVFDPLGAQAYPWTLNPTDPSAPAVRTTRNSIDNIEQVLVDAPMAGVWRIDVVGFSIPQGPQSFSLAASPRLVPCSPAGVITLNRALYGCTSTAEIKVVDCDLNANSGVLETATAILLSTSEPGGETVVLTETAPDSADFRGTIALNPLNSPGVLHVADGDTITAQYIDADDGQGGNNVSVTTAAAADCQGPVISDLQLTDVGSDRATITFQTDENAAGMVRYGPSCGALTQSASDAGQAMSHSVLITGLTSGTVYMIAVDATDGQENTSTDDNGGTCYAFTTLSAIYDFSLDVDPGWTTQDQWAFGVPTGGGSSNRDPTSGFTGPNVYGYNLAGDYSNNLPAHCVGAATIPSALASLGMFATRCLAASPQGITTTALDCTGLADVMLRFRRWRAEGFSPLQGGGCPSRIRAG